MFGLMRVQEIPDNYLQILGVPEEISEKILNYLTSKNILAVRYGINSIGYL